MDQWRGLYAGLQDEENGSPELRSRLVMQSQKQKEREVTPGEPSETMTVLPRETVRMFTF